MTFKLEPPTRQHIGKMARGSKVAAAVKKFEKEASKKTKKTAAAKKSEKTTGLRRSKRIADQQLKKKLKDVIFVVSRFTRMNISSF